LGIGPQQNLGAKNYLFSTTLQLSGSMANICGAEHDRGNRETALETTGPLHHLEIS